MQPHNPEGYRIGQAAALSGTSAATIRFYEAQSLLSPSKKSSNSYRFYSDSDVHQLRFIRLCRAMDMTLDEVRTLLALDLRNKVDCTSARVTLDAHLGHVRQRLKELKALEKDLVALRKRCDGQDAHCHIIEALHQQADQQARLMVLPARGVGQRQAL
jgi:DNA-binding transcriptional MerR regulator